MEALFIYNLYPRLYRSIEDWSRALQGIARMGFNSIYINPIHYPGFSGSLYAPKNYYQFNDLIFPKGEDPEKLLRKFIADAEKLGIKVFMDLVVNHTSIDSPLIQEHKNWYILENNDVKRPGAWENGEFKTWGDLAQFNLDGSPDKTNLWKYLLEMCEYFIHLGFSGFRCDAAYQVSEDFWRYLIHMLKDENKEIVFLAETLGCTPVQIQTLANCGFDYIFNSSKWWDFNDPWCLEQYEMTRNIAASISFPDGHDTERLFLECNGNQEKFLQRIYFSALFSKGFMITTGLEYGFVKRINTVTTTPDDWEETGRDFTKNIHKILEIKRNLLPLREESPIRIVDQANWMNVFCFYKEWSGEKVLIVFNKDPYQSQPVCLGNLEAILGNRNVRDYSPEERLKGTCKELNIQLKPGECKVFAPEEYYGRTEEKG